MRITIGALQDMSLDAALEYIAPKATQSNGANQFEIKAAIHLNPQSEKDSDKTIHQAYSGTNTIRAGFSANAEIVLAEAKQVLTLPESAIEFVGDSTFVNIVKGTDKEKQYERRAVDTGLSDGVNIEIKKGINDKDKVRGPQIISDDQND